MTRVEIPVTLLCNDCDFEFEVSARWARKIRRGECKQICPSCRRGGAAPRLEVTDADRAYWLERFTLEEIRELALGIWTPDEAGTAQLLVAGSR